MQKSIIKKGLVFLVIILFIGVAVAPSVTSIEFSMNKTSNNGDLVEITLQLCRTDGVEDHKRYITQEKYEQLDILIESFKADLENSESYDESVGIYNDMVVSLDELGLLPKGMSVKEVQSLVTGRSYRFSRVFSLLEQFFKSDKTSDAKLQKNNKGDIYENQVCLLSSVASITWLNVADFILGWIDTFIFWLNIGRVYYGKRQSPNDGDPAVGWINTIGLNGIWTYKGEFHGELGEFEGAVFPALFFYRGAKFFRGILLNDLCFGRAMHVKIETGKP